MSTRAPSARISDRDAGLRTCRPRGSHRIRSTRRKIEDKIELSKTGANQHRHVRTPGFSRSTKGCRALPAESNSAPGDRLETHTVRRWARWAVPNGRHVQFRERATAGKADRFSPIPMETGCSSSTPRRREAVTADRGGPTQSSQADSPSKKLEIRNARAAKLGRGRLAFGDQVRSEDQRALRSGARSVGRPAASR